MGRRYIPSVWVLTFCVLLQVSCSHETPEADNSANDQAESAVVQPVDSVTIELAGIDSTSVFELLQVSHRVEYRNSAMGVFVTSIDAVEGGSSYYWVYSVNDSMGQIAADDYVTAEGDRVKWHFRKSSQ